MPTVKLVDENTTNPRIRAVFDDIKATRKVERISNIWRALAANPDHLEMCWQQVKTIMKPGKLDLMTKALARHGGTAWLWVHENCGPKGGHCHLLAHVPAKHVKRLTGLQRGWLRRITLHRYRARVIFSRPIGKRLGAETTDPADYAINLAVVLAYLLKGASPEAASQFALVRLEPGGRVIGKRCGTSQNIGAKARKAKD